MTQPLHPCVPFPQSAIVCSVVIAAGGALGTIVNPVLGNIETTYVDDSHWSYRCYYMPDNDQRRGALPNTGKMYCVPTSVYNALGYIAAHGYPEVWPGDHFYTWYLNPANYVSTTGHIDNLGSIMGTHPEDGTFGAGFMFGLTSMLDSGDFIVGQVSASGSHFPTLDSMVSWAGTKPVALVSIGWYLDEPLSGRDGGHMVTLDEVIREGSLRLIGFRDPGTDEDGRTIDLDSQSAPRSSRYVVASETREFFTEGGFVTRQVDRIVGMDSDTHAGLIDGYTYILPAHGFTFSPDFAEFIYHQPRAFTWDEQWQPERRFSVSVGDIIRGIGMNPATLDALVLATDSTTGASVLWRIDPQTGEQQPRATFSNPFGMDIGRRRRVYVLDDSGLTLRCINVDGAHAIEEAALALPESAKAVAYDDSTDQLYVLAVGSSAIYMVDAESLTVAAVSQRPAGISLVGRTSAAVSPTDGRLWLAAELSGALVSLQLVPGGTASALTVPHGVSRPKGIQVDDLNRVYVHDDGIVHAYRDFGGTEGWAETDDAPFAGVAAAGGLFLARSRTDHESWMTGPAYRNVLPSTVLEGAPACLADITGAGGVPDGDVGVADLLAVLSAWGEVDSLADVAPNGSVDVADLLAVLSAWGPC